MQETDENIISHLNALRSTLLCCLGVLAVCLIPLFFVAPYALDIFLKIILDNQEITFNYFSPLEVFFIQIKMAVVLDILVCFPYMAKKIWDFLLPALYENEQHFIKSVVVASSVLFITGALFCLFFILPMLIHFGLSFISDNITPLFGISNIVSLSLWLCLIFGLMFQFPLITIALLSFGIVSYETLRTKRPYIFVGILILSALLTPPDIISQLLLTFPTYALFEIGLFFGKKQKKS